METRVLIQPLGNLRFRGLQMTLNISKGLWEGEIINSHKIFTDHPQQEILLNNMVIDVLIEENQAHNFSVGLQTSGTKMFPSRLSWSRASKYPSMSLFYAFEGAYPSAYLQERLSQPAFFCIMAHTLASSVILGLHPRHFPPRYFTRQSPITTETNSLVFKWSHGGVSSITTKFWVGWPFSSISFVDPEHVCQDLSASPQGTETKVICIKNESN